MSTSILSIKLHNEYIAKRKDFSLSGCTMSLAAAPVAWTREEVDRCPSTRVPSPRICESLFLSYKDTLKFQYLFFTFQCFRSQSSSSSSLHSELHFTVSYLTKLWWSKKYRKSSFWCLGWSKTTASSTFDGLGKAGGWAQGHLQQAVYQTSSTTRVHCASRLKQKTRVSISKKFSRCNDQVASNPTRAATTEHTEKFRHIWAWAWVKENTKEF